MPGDAGDAVKDPYKELESMHSYEDYVLLRKYVAAVNDIIKRGDIIKSIAVRTGRERELLGSRRLTLIDVNKIIKEFAVEYGLPRFIKKSELNRLGEHSLKVAAAARTKDPTVGFAKEDHVDEAFKAFIGKRKQGAKESEDKLEAAKKELNGEKGNRKGAGLSEEEQKNYNVARQTRQALGSRIWAGAKMVLQVAAVVGLSVGAVGAVGSIAVSALGVAAGVAGAVIPVVALVLGVPLLVRGVVKIIKNRWEDYKKAREKHKSLREKKKQIKEKIRYLKQQHRAAKALVAADLKAEVHESYPGLSYASLYSGMTLDSEYEDVSLDVEFDRAEILDHAVESAYTELAGLVKVGADYKSKDQLKVLINKAVNSIVTEAKVEPKVARDKLIAKINAGEHKDALAEAISETDPKHIINNAVIKACNDFIAEVKPGGVLVDDDKKIKEAFVKHSKNLVGAGLGVSIEQAKKLLEEELGARGDADIISKLTVVGETKSNVVVNNAYKGFVKEIIADDGTYIEEDKLDNAFTAAVAEIMSNAGMSEEDAKKAFISKVKAEGKHEAIIAEIIFAEENPEVVISRDKKTRKERKAEEKKKKEYDDAKKAAEERAKKARDDAEKARDGAIKRAKAALTLGMVTHEGKREKDYEKAVKVLTDANYTTEKARAEIKRIIEEDAKYTEAYSIVVGVKAKNIEITNAVEEVKKDIISEIGRLSDKTAGAVKTAIDGGLVEDKIKSKLKSGTLVKDSDISAYLTDVKKKEIAKAVIEQLKAENVLESTIVAESLDAYGFADDATKERKDEAERKAEKIISAVDSKAEETDKEAKYNDALTVLKTVYIEEEAKAKLTEIINKKAAYKKAYDYKLKAIKAEAVKKEIESAVEKLKGDIKTEIDGYGDAKTASNVLDTIQLRLTADAVMGKLGEGTIVKQKDVKTYLSVDTQKLITEEILEHYGFADALTALKGAEDLIKEGARNTDETVKNTKYDEALTVLKTVYTDEKEAKAILTKIINKTEYKKAYDYKLKAIKAEAVKAEIEPAVDAVKDEIKARINGLSDAEKTAKNVLDIIDEMLIADAVLGELGDKPTATQSDVKKYLKENHLTITKEILENCRLSEAKTGLETAETLITAGAEKGKKQKEKTDAYNSALSALQPEFGDDSAKSVLNGIILKKGLAKAYLHVFTKDYLAELPKGIQDIFNLTAEYAPERTEEALAAEEDDAEDEEDPKEKAKADAKELIIEGASLDDDRKEAKYNEALETLKGAGYTPEEAKTELKTIIEPNDEYKTAYETLLSGASAIEEVDAEEEEEVVVIEPEAYAEDDAKDEEEVVVIGPEVDAEEIVITEPEDEEAVLIEPLVYAEDEEKGIVIGPSAEVVEDIRRYFKDNVEKKIVDEIRDVTDYKKIAGIFIKMLDAKAIYEAGGHKFATQDQIEYYINWNGLEIIESVCVKKGLDISVKSDVKMEYIRLDTLMYQIKRIKTEIGAKTDVKDIAKIITSGMAAEIIDDITKEEKEAAERSLVAELSLTEDQKNELLIELGLEIPVMEVVFEDAEPEVDPTEKALQEAKNILIKGADKIKGSDKAKKKEAKVGYNDALKKLTESGLSEEDAKKVLESIIRANKDLKNYSYVIGKEETKKDKAEEPKRITHTFIINNKVKQITISKELDDKIRSMKDEGKSPQEITDVIVNTEEFRKEIIVEINKTAKMENEKDALAVIAGLASSKEPTSVVTQTQQENVKAVIETAKVDLETGLKENEQFIKENVSGKETVTGVAVKAIEVGAEGVGIGAPDGFVPAEETLPVTKVVTIDQIIKNAFDIHIAKSGNKSLEEKTARYNSALAYVKEKLAEAGLTEYSDAVIERKLKDFIFGQYRRAYNFLDAPAVTPKGSAYVKASVDTTSIAKDKYSELRTRAKEHIAEKVKAAQERDGSYFENADWLVDMSKSDVSKVMKVEIEEAATEALKDVEVNKENAEKVLKAAQAFRDYAKGSIRSRYYRKAGKDGKTGAEKLEAEYNSWVNGEKQKFDEIQQKIENGEDAGVDMVTYQKLATKHLYWQEYEAVRQREKDFENSIKGQEVEPEAKSHEDALKENLVNVYMAELTGGKKVQAKTTDGNIIDLTTEDQIRDAVEKGYKFVDEVLEIEGEGVELTDLTATDETAVIEPKVEEPIAEEPEVEAPVEPVVEEPKVEEANYEGLDQDKLQFFIEEIKAKIEDGHFIDLESYLRIYGFNEENIRQLKYDLSEELLAKNEESRIKREDLSLDEYWIERLIGNPRAAHLAETFPKHYSEFLSNFGKTDSERSKAEFYVYMAATPEYKMCIEAYSEDIYNNSFIKYATKKARKELSELYNKFVEEFRIDADSLFTERMFFYFIRERVDEKTVSWLKNSNKEYEEAKAKEQAEEQKPEPKIEQAPVSEVDKAKASILVDQFINGAKNGRSFTEEELDKVYAAAELCDRKGDIENYYPSARQNAISFTPEQEAEIERAVEIYVENNIDIKGVKMQLEIAKNQTGTFTDAMIEEAVSRIEKERAKQAEIIINLADMLESSPIDVRGYVISLLKSGDISKEQARKIMEQANKRLEEIGHKAIDIDSVLGADEAENEHGDEE